MKCPTCCGCRGSCPTLYGSFPKLGLLGGYRGSIWVVYSLGFPKVRGTLFESPYNKDYCILGFLLGSLSSEKLPHPLYPRKYITSDILCGARFSSTNDRTRYSLCAMQFFFCHPRFGSVSNVLDTIPNWNLDTYLTIPVHHKQSVKPPRSVYSFYMYSLAGKRYQTAFKLYKLREVSSNSNGSVLSHPKPQRV